MKYWEECIRECFDDCGIKATEEQIKYVIEGVECSHENYSMYMGYDCIGNPKDSEIEELKNKIKLLEKEKDDWIGAFQKNVSMRRNCDISDVTVKKTGHAEIRI